MFFATSSSFFFYTFLDTFFDCSFLSLILNPSCVSADYLQCYFDTVATFGGFPFCVSEFLYFCISADCLQCYFETVATFGGFPLLCVSLTQNSPCTVCTITKPTDKTTKDFQAKTYVSDQTKMIFNRFCSLRIFI